MERREVTKGILAAVIAGALHPSWARGPRGSIIPVGSGTHGWQTLKVGSGGYVQGMSIAPDGTMVARTDTNGGFYYNGTQWVQLFNLNSLPSAFVNNSDIGVIGPGVFEVQIAASNTNIFYASYMGYIWVSSNRGVSWTQTAFSQNAAGMNPADGYRQYGQKIAVDPNNSSIVFVGTENNGLWFTTNGGTSWTQVSTSSVPAGIDAGITGILFYGNGTVTGGATQTLYAASYSNGVYVSNNGGSTWALTSGGPTSVVYAAIDSSGNYYCVGNGGAHLFKYSGGSWTQLSAAPGNPFQTIAINPFNISEIVVIDASGQLIFSYNAGSTWTGPTYTLTAPVSTDIPWLAVANGSGGGLYFDAGGSAFSPVTNGELFMSAGVGVWKMPFPSSATGSTSFTWTDMSVGIEQLVANEIVIAPVSGSTPLLASWDRPFFDITSLTSYPSTYGPVAGGAIEMGWSLDYASSNPSYIFGWSTWTGTNQSGYTTNNGASWTYFPTQWSTNNGGSIAASTPSNIIVSPAGGVQPGYTTNGGTSWTGITLPGVSSWSTYYAGYYLTQRPVTADRVSANTFYLYYPGNGVYISTNSGATWTQQFAGYIDSGTHSVYSFELLSVPGNSGHLFYTPGNISGQKPNNSGSSVPFYRSTNGGASWSTVSNVTGVQHFNFGAVAPGHSYPSIYVYGWVSGVLGVWQSVDDASTWTNLGNPQSALQTMLLVSCVAADPNNFGYVYVGTDGGGYAYYTP